MEVDKVRELIDLMKQNDLTELEIEEGDSKIILKRGGQVVVSAPVPSSAPVINAGPAAGPLPAEPSAPAKADADGNLAQVTSPIVGTFYAAPSPSADPFIKVGDKVTEESVVGIIEAMKVMNEIKSEINGVIRKVLVENGSAVEFGQPLFLVEPG